MCFENVFLKCYSNILLALATGYGIFDTKPLLQPVARAQLAESSRSQEIPRLKLTSASIADVEH